MRLFIAIEFDDDTKRAIATDIPKIKELCLSGSFSRVENLHLTLVFIGEADFTDIADIKAVMDKSAAGIIPLRVGDVSRFKRNGGDILHRKISEPQQTHKLHELYERLYRGLVEEGFEIEDRPYRPHITLARQVRWNEKPENAIKKCAEVVKPIAYTAKSMTLMCSERIDGKLTYTPIYKKSL